MNTIITVVTDHENMKDGAWFSNMLTPEDVREIKECIQNKIKQKEEEKNEHSRFSW